jgi:hypothetical protein
MVETYNIINYALNFNTTQIFFFDLDSLGVGSVRCGVIIDGVMIVLFRRNHANLETLPYLQTSSLFCRYEILNGVGAVLVNCMTVISEGGYTISGRLISIDNGIVGKAITNSVMRPLIALRISATSKINALLQSLQIITIAAVNMLYHIYIFRDGLNFTLTGSVWATLPNSGIEYDISSSAMTSTGYTPIVSGYVGKADASMILNTSEYNNVIMTKNINDVSDILVIGARNVGGNSDVVCSVLFKELL